MSFKMPKDKARFVQERFGRIASRYDLFNDLITQTQHRRWKKALIKLVQLQPNMRVLDVCCGTGDLVLRSCQQIKGKATMVAIDFSFPMLNATKARLASYPHAYTVAADAVSLPFANQTFDVVTIGYGLRNVVNLENCLVELKRIIKSGGCFASLDIGKVRYSFLKPFVHAYMFHIVPRIGKLLLPTEEMFDYLPHSTQAYPSQHQLSKMLKQLGFSSVYLKEYMFGTAAIHIARKL